MTLSTTITTLWSVMDSRFGHWNISLVGSFNPTDHYGFVYRITHRESQLSYIGQKCFTKGKNWKTYTSSSAELNVLIKKHGKESCDFMMLELCDTKRLLTYTECKYLFTYDVLRNASFLNRNILGRFFRFT